jgi:ABC-type nickel/cobalt efflux system permease component RcnA
VILNLSKLVPYSGMELLQKVHFFLSILFCLYFFCFCASGKPPRRPHAHTHTHIQTHTKTHSHNSLHCVKALRLQAVGLFCFYSRSLLTLLPWTTVLPSPHKHTHTNTHTNTHTQQFALRPSATFASKAQPTGEVTVSMRVGFRV